MTAFLVLLLTAFAITVGFGLANYHANVGAVLIGSVAALVGLQGAYVLAWLVQVSH